MALTKHMLLSMLLLCHFLLLKAHSKCPKSFVCRNFSLDFPFTDSNHPDCGFLVVDGCDSKEGFPTLRSTWNPYQILGRPSANKFTIHDHALENLLRSSTCVTLANLSLPRSPFVTFTFSPNITFFTCYNQTPIHDHLQSYHSLHCNISTVYYKTPATQHHAPPPIPPECSLTQLPIKPSRDNNSTNLLHLLSADFTLNWNVSRDCFECHNRGGRCFSDNQQQFYCSKTGIHIRPIQLRKGQLKVKTRIRSIGKQGKYNFEV